MIKNILTELQSSSQRVDGIFSNFQSFGQPGRGQPDGQSSQLASDYDRTRRNRSLDRSTELEQFNTAHRGSSRALATGTYSGSTTHLNLQLGPLQLPPRGFGHGYQMSDCEYNFSLYLTTYR